MAAPELPTQVVEEEEDQPEPGKTLEGLAALWEEDSIASKKMGVITFETMALNYKVLSSQDLAPFE